MNNETDRELRNVTDLSSPIAERFSQRDVAHTCGAGGLPIIECLDTFCCPWIQGGVWHFCVEIKIKWNMNMNQTES